MKKWLALVTALVVLGGGGTLVVRHRMEQARERDRADALSIATRFLAAWQKGEYAAMGALTAQDPDAGDSFGNLRERLGITALTVTPGPLTGDVVSYTAQATLRGLGELTWSSEVLTTKTSKGRRVAFRSDTVYPGLLNGQVLARSEPLVSQGELTDRTGRPIRAASPDLAANVLGRQGKDPTGLERIYADKLTGTSGGRVQVVERGSDRVIRVIKEFPPKPSAPVQTTLDLDVQQAGEQALADVTGPAALVAIDTKTGEVRAIVNHPVVGVPTALRSEAPGSTFKVIVAAAALTNGLKPETVIDCPEQVVFGGKAFRNDEALPFKMTFEQAFARSCNTAFLNLADGFPKGTATRTAALFGFGRGDLLPIGGEGGEVPAPSTTSEAYADIIGQGRVEASPLLLASMSAAVASGVWRQPHLVSGPAPSNVVTSRILPDLRRMMRAVVSGGTAASAGLPAGTAGKTGTAQYGTTVPLPTHAWFTGYQDDLAFCVYVQDGSSGGRVAAPLAARFLRALPGA
ncbi:MAG: penicillin-binding transpeptidase domain-containing protein [Mycobacteriales bacterium]